MHPIAILLRHSFGHQEAQELGIFGLLCLEKRGFYLQALAHVIEGSAEFGEFITATSIDLYTHVTRGDAAGRKLKTLERSNDEGR